MNVFDYFVCGITGISVVLGLWRGIVGEVIALVAWILAFMCARWFGADVAVVYTNVISDQTIRLIAGLVTVFVIVLILMALLRLALQGLIKALGLSLSDRLLGVIFGGVRAMLILLLLVAVAGMTSIPEEQWWKEAYFSRPLETAVMAGAPWLPPEMSNRIRFR